MDKKIKFALIGCGRIAGRHIDAILSAKNAELIAVCDMDEARAKEKAQQGNCPYFLNYHDMFAAHPEIEVVTILTPSGMHYEHSLDVIRHYQKHLLIEKPFVMRIEHGLHLKQVADEFGVKLFPVYQNRFNKAVQRVKQAMQPENGELGKLRVGTVRLRWCRPQRYYDLSEWRGTWAMDGGALTNQGIHYIDLLRYLCGDVKRVNSLLATLGAQIEAEDTAVGTIEFENGALGVIEIMTSARHDDFEASISCVCENGLAVISGIATNELQVFSPKPDECVSNSEDFPTVYGFGHDVIVQSVAEALLQDKPAAIEFEDGMNSIRLLHAIYRSDELGGWIDVAKAGDSERLGIPEDRLAEPYRTPFDISAEEVA